MRSASSAAVHPSPLQVVPQRQQERGGRAQESPAPSSSPNPPAGENGKEKKEPQPPASPASQRKLNVAIELVSSRKAALDQQQSLNTKARSLTLSADVEYNRQLNIIKTELWPDIDVPRSDDELSYFDEADKIVALFDDVSLKRMTYKDYPQLEFRLAYKKGRSLGFLELRTMLRCTALDVIAKRFDFADFDGIQIIETKNSHAYIGLLGLSAPGFGFLPRQFLFIAVWRQISLTATALSKSRHPDSVSSIYQIVVMPTTHPHVPETPDFIRGTTHEVTFLFEHSSSCTTEYVTYAHSDPKGAIPHFIINTKIVGNNGKRALQLLQMAQRRRLLVELDEHDGVALGEAFSLAKRVAKNNDRKASMSIVARSVVAQHLSLRQASELHPALLDIVAAVLENELARPSACKVKLGDLNPEDGKKIGRALASSLLSATDPAGGVAEWFGFFPALIEMKEKFVWFEPMMASIATRLLQDSRWGIIMRLAIGLILNLTDILSDIVMIVYFMQEGRNVYAYVTIACVSTSIFVQATVVFLQHAKASRRRQLMEVVLVLTFMKPIVDTYNVCTRKGQEAGQTVDPLFEMTLGKGIEIVFESIPGSSIQMFAYITQKDRSKRTALALASLLSSMATTAYLSATIAYDLDTDPHRRKDQPWVYGMIPASPGRRAAAFASTFALSLTQIFSRTLACCLLAASSGTVLVCILVGESALYILYKLLRRDFTYFPPFESSTVSFVTSAMARFLRKIVADVTGLLQERHPLEMGGFYFSLNMVWSQIFPYVAVLVLNKQDDGERAIWLSAEVLRDILIISTAVWAVSAISFSTAIKRNYLRTFLSTETASQYTIRIFRESTSDGARFNGVFGNHPSYSEPINREVKQWLFERYPIWQLERPPWFTDAAISLIPDDLLPKEALQDLIAKGRGARRRSSIGEKLGGGGEKPPIISRESGLKNTVLASAHPKSAQISPV